MNIRLTFDAYENIGGFNRLHKGYSYWTYAFRDYCQPGEIVNL